MTRLPTKVFKKGSVSICEEIRINLKLSLSQFSDSIGYSPGYYSNCLEKDEISKQAELAAKYLQMCASKDSDSIVVLSINKEGVKTLCFKEPSKIKVMIIDGIEHYLIPKP